jgi:hypothetical protein
MDGRHKRQTSTATPAAPGDLPWLLERIRVSADDGETKLSQQLDLSVIGRSGDGHRPLKKRGARVRVRPPFRHRSLRVRLIKT